MIRKIVYVILTVSVLLSCQQETIKPIDKASENKESIVTAETTKIIKRTLSSQKGTQQLYFTATVKYLNLEGGFFGLITKEGQHWLPVNLAKKFQLDGAVIKVKGHAIKNMMTIQQWGTPFKITHIELIKVD